MAAQRHFDDDLGLVIDHLYLVVTNGQPPGQLAVLVGQLLLHPVPQQLPQRARALPQLLV